MLYFRSPVVIALTIVACATGAPKQIQDENIDAIVAEFKKELSESDGLGDPDFQNYNSLTGDDPMGMGRTGLVSLQRGTFVGSKKYEPNAKQKIRLMNGKGVSGVRVLPGILPKRNFDEIDRTNFDSFVKKNHIGLPERVQASMGNLNEYERGFNDYNRRRLLADAYFASRQR